MLKMIRRVLEPVNEIGPCKSFMVLGDPGCDGLGAEIMSTFAAALSVEQADFRIVLGDIVPSGSDLFYKNVSEFIETVAAVPVYLISGNHDTKFYSEYFGLRNYALYNDKLLIVALDNARRSFDLETLQFLEATLRDFGRQNIVLLFHIPPPNHFVSNGVSVNEWNKVMTVIEPYRERIKYLVCGHVHNFFEDEVDGMTLIVTGGAGARLEPITSLLDKSRSYHHVVRFFFDDSDVLCHCYIPLDGKNYTGELKDEHLRGCLSSSLANECQAHVKYRLYAEHAEEMGKKGLAQLFRAAADAEFFHARNHFHVLGELKTVWDYLRDSESNENTEATVTYKGCLDYARQNHYGLAGYTFSETMEAEKVHERLFREAIALDGNIEEATYYTCTSCGYTFRGKTYPEQCPICGAPQDKIRKV